MSQSIQTLIEEFENIVSRKIDLDFSDISSLIELLPHLIKEDSKSDVLDKFHEF